MDLTNVSLPNGNGFGKNVISFSVDNSLSADVDNSKKDILILENGLNDGFK